MKKKQGLMIMVLCLFALALSFATWEKASATENTTTITKPLVYQNALDISLGKGGVYFPSSNYTGKATLNRIEPVDIKGMTFTQRWLDIHLYDSTGKEFKNVYGFVYIYFNLNVEDRAAWNQGKLSIYHYNEAKKTWEKSETYLLPNKNVPHGRVRVLVQEFGLYGLAITR